MPSGDLEVSQSLLGFLDVDSGLVYWQVVTFTGLDAENYGVGFDSFQYSDRNAIQPPPTPIACLMATWSSLPFVGIHSPQIPFAYQFLTRSFCPIWLHPVCAHLMKTDSMKQGQLASLSKDQEKISSSTLPVVNLKTFTDLKDL